MKEVFTLNGKQYEALEIDYNMLCDFEEMGINIEEADVKNLSLIRAYTALCMGCSKEQAGRELMLHISGGEDIKQLNEIMSKKFEESGFFHQTGNEPQTKTQSKKQTKQVKDTAV